MSPSPSTSLQVAVNDKHFRHCQAGGWGVGLRAGGTAYAMVLNCKMWACAACGAVKRELATRGPRQHLATGAPLYVLEISDNGLAETVRELVSQRAVPKRKHAREIGVAVALLGGEPIITVVEYLCVRRPEGSVIFASVNLGGARAFPRPGDFRELDSAAEFEALIEHWFRKEGLRQKFDVPGTSDLRTSASAGWTQKEQLDQPSGAIMVAGIRTREAKDAVLAEYERLARERCTASSCFGHSVHELSKEEMVKLLIQAARLPYPDDPFAFDGAEAMWINPTATELVSPS
ncbi:MAG: hypothetical protein ACYCST_12140 [Acidimicrobiales bacterium]